jgi:multidrug transporter EmrE-like cation transporter
VTVVPVTVSGTRLAEWLLLALAVVAVAVADVFLKKATVQGDIVAAFRSPWLWAAIALYLFQIGFFVYAFVAGWELSVLGSLQTILYAVIVLVAGVTLYQESLAPAQLAGVGLALGGIVLIGWR